MAIRTIRTEGDEILKKKSKPVEKIDDKILELIKDMQETLKKYDGVGLAAVQVGILKQVIIIDLGEEGEQYVIINPEIISKSGNQVVEEGCLSFPNQYAKLVRPAQVVVEAQNEKGETIRIEADGLLAQALSHELDHLEGILFVDKMIPGTMEYSKPEKD